MFSCLICCKFREALEIESDNNIYLLENEPQKHVKWSQEPLQVVRLAESASAATGE